MAGVSRSDREVSMPIAAIDTANDLQRRLIWHGVFLFLLGLIGGLFVYSMTNPRMGLTAHVGTVTNGTFLIAVGAAWRALALSPRGARSACWLLVVGSYGGSAGLFLAAILGTRDSTPLHGAAQSASAWREGLVMLVLVAFGVALMAGTVLALWGFSRRRGGSQPG
jgi:hydroxylaminobenzene mutase